MKPFHRAGLAAGFASALAVISTVGASAAPVSSPRAETFEIDCGTLGTFLIAPPPGNGEWTPGLFVGNHKVLVPYRFTYTFQVGDEAPMSETISKKAPMPARSVTCSFGDSFEEAGVVFTFAGTATGPLRGKP